MDTVYKPTPESSPEMTKKSWFGSLMASEKDETFTILITGKPLSTVKADLIHALLSVSCKKFCMKNVEIDTYYLVSNVVEYYCIFVICHFSKMYWFYNGELFCYFFIFLYSIR